MSMYDFAQEEDKMKNLTPSRVLKEYDGWDGEKMKVPDYSFELGVEAPVAINGLKDGKIYGNKK